MSRSFLVPPRLPQLATPPAVEAGAMYYDTDDQLVYFSNASAWVSLATVDLGSRTFKQGVRAATTANITLSGTQTIDGVAVVAGDRVLVKNQTAGAENGIYLCAAGAWTRATDFDSSADVANGAVTIVNSGTVNGDTRWAMSTVPPITLGTTSLVFDSTIRVPGITNLTLSTGAGLVLGTLAGLNLAMDSNEIMARNNGAISTLALNKSGGDVSVGVIVSSDAPRIVMGASGTPLQETVWDFMTNGAAVDHDPATRTLDTGSITIPAEWPTYRVRLAISVEIYATNIARIFTISGRYNGASVDTTTQSRRHYTTSEPQCVSSTVITPSQTATGARTFGVNIVCATTDALAFSDQVTVVATAYRTT